MKFKTFRAMLVGGAAVAALGGGFALMHGHHGGAAPQLPSSAPSVAPTNQGPLAGVAPPALNGIDGTPLRPMDEQILAETAGGINSAKMKDVFPRAPYKVNLYEEMVAGVVGRAKVDLNRNGKWDEKWVILAGGGAKREVAPNDDENYTEKFVRSGSTWVAERDKAAANK